ncbi:hypothetical protein [Rossellomorea sp. FS2]|uniref:hypothetical protein n=1 Tax=Rossellomorea sp. FS2 TaxID=3391447 RepID=UPI003A4D2A7B
MKGSKYFTIDLPYPHQPSTSAAEGGRLLRKSREDETPQARGGSSTDPRKATIRSGTERSISLDTSIKNIGTISFPFIFNQ